MEDYTKLGVLKSDYPVAQITLPRWQKEWIQSQHSLNFSGLVQEILCEVIRATDPKYFDVHANKIEKYMTQRKEMIKTIVAKTSNY